VNQENDVRASIGTVKAFLVWMYAGGYVILAGGEINASLKVHPRAASAEFSFCDL
jgi:uncharacterized BrkB/YihY/UPF0761 family membrane protein